MNNQKQFFFALVVISVVIGGCENTNITQTKREAKSGKDNELLSLHEKPTGLICNWTETEKITTDGEQYGEAKTTKKDENYIINTKEKNFYYLNKFGEVMDYANRQEYNVSLEPNYIKITRREEEDVDETTKTDYSASIIISRKTLEYSTNSLNIFTSSSAPFLMVFKSEGKGKCRIVDPDTFKKTENKF